ncbi:MAG: hypothetical protein NZT92_13715 [Abditibacteriales bacterium]|nr:hypothetical protein [Abditibacteriales bacterium]MDW8365384.1 hypothetical protein [Abditibacteriales bacterium]
MNAFGSPIAWHKEFADTLVLYCADGRFVRQCEDFLTNGLKVATCDHFVVPGGAGWLVLDALTLHAYDAAREHIGFLVQAHALQRAVLIAHEDCGFYRHRFPHATADELFQAQIKDLRQAATTLRGWFPQLTVEMYYARVEGERVEFVPVQ